LSEGTTQSALSENMSSKDVKEPCKILCS